MTDYKGNKENGDTRIIIENKIYAGDQNKQLERYHQHLQKNENEKKKYEKTALFYLTLEGKDAASYSRKDLKSNKDYYLLNYADHIKVWLNDILKKCCDEPKLKTYIEDYLLVIDEFTKYNSILDKIFDSKSGLNKDKFNALLEFRFWQALEEKILEEYDSQYSIDYQHRYYSYSKTLKCQTGKGNKLKDYGIILERKEKNDLPDFRLCVSPSTKKVSLKFGRFNGINWDNSVDKNNLKHIKNVEDILDLSTLKNTNDFVRHINDILSKINELI